MKASDVLAHFRQIGTWVNWENKCNDKFLYGNPEQKIHKIAVAWIPTNEAIRQAGESGCDLFITHELTFYDGTEGVPTVDVEIAKKKALFDRFGMTVLRCHDTWDRMPKYGIPDAWAEFLGFATEDRPVDSFYKICLVGEMTVETLARRVLEKVRPLGQDSVQIFGDKSKTVTRMSVGTGAITRLSEMHALNADVALATDDGMTYWTRGGNWAADVGFPVLVVNHATSEKPGMQAMTKYLPAIFPDIPVEYFDVAFPYSTIMH